MTEITSRLSTALADRYQIERHVGEGGMASVYLAEDLKHKRKVAVKVLRPELAAVLGAERFVQEIATTANLQHPHILPLFDSGEADSFLYYVMPFIDGETLRDKLNRETQLGIEEAVKITTEVADALDYAHRHDVIHRDIKPENILLHDGRPMVADFGIALAVSAAAGGRMTETGLSLGTPHYMSPEQATAEKDLTNRSDIYSLGSVLYEMLTGEPPHMGNSAQAIIMKIVTDDARPVTELRKSVPPNVAAAVTKALEKLAADRFGTAREFAEAVTNPAFTLPSMEPGPVGSGGGRSRGWSVSPWAVAATAVGIGLALVWVWSLLRSGPDPEPVTRFTFTLGSAYGGRMEIDISPDGRRIVQPHGADRGALSLWLRDLASLELSVIAGTPGNSPRFSPDGRWIAYDQGELLKVPADGGTPAVLADACFQPDWIDAETLVCVGRNWGLARVSSGGGPVEELTAPDTADGEIGHWSPDPLPGGNAILFTSYRRPTTRIEAYDLRSGERSVLVENAVMARYARSGHLLYVRDDALFAVRFDPRTLQTHGGAVPVLNDVASVPSDAVAAFAISDNGTLVAVRQSEWSVPSQVVWVDRRGLEQPAIGEPGNYAHPRLSPDGTKIVLTVAAGHRDLWIFDLQRGALIQLTRSPTSEFRPVWTPDGRHVFYTNETPAYDIYQVAIDGSSPPTPVVRNVVDKYPTSLSPDGSTLAYREASSGRNRTLLLSLEGNGSSHVFGDTTVGTFDAAYSPDGAWIAYSEGDFSGLSNVFVRRADGSGGRTQISVGGGKKPHWTKGGREIVFQKGNGLYAVDVDAPSDVVGVPTMLFEGSYDLARGYDVTADGSRFLIVKPGERPEALPILVIMNFFEELKAKVGGN